MKIWHKLLIMCFIILAIIIISSTYSVNKIRQGSEEMSSILSKIEIDIKNHNNDSAISNTYLYKQVWDKQKVIWTAFISEEEINILDASSERLLVYVTEDEKTDALSEIAEIKAHLDHMPLIHSITFSNIL